jgi:ATP-dependent protease ClpP protease subunit
MPYENEHSARVRDPKDFDQNSFRRKNISPGIDIIIGKLDGGDKTETQTYRFDASKFTEAEVKQWLQDHDITYISFEAAKSEMNIYMLPIIGVIGEDFKYSDLLMHLNRAKDSSVIKLIIDSPGGFVDEAEKMKNTLESSGKTIMATNSGDVASAAVSIFLTAKKEYRTFNPVKGEFLIHYPYLSPLDGGATGTSDEIAQVAGELKQMEKQISKQYEKATGTESNILIGFMSENKPLTEQQIQELGFATIIKTQELKAVAYYKSNNYKMETKEIKEKLNVFEVAINKIVKLLSPRALMIKDVNGKEIDFGNEIETPDQIKVGVKATIDGSPAVGDFVLQTGETYKFEGGELKEIIQAGSENEEMKKLREENEKLKADLSEAQLKITEQESSLKSSKEEMTKLSTEFYAFRNQFSKGDPNNSAIPGGDSKKVLMTKEEFEKCL